MQFYFIRHGHSQNNQLWDETGSRKGRSQDAELTPVGRQQSELLAWFLRDRESEFGFTHLYTSLMVRAIATGVVLADALNLPLVAWEDLHETGGIYVEDEQTGEHFGQPGKNRADFQRYPRLVLPESLGEAGWWNRPFEEREQRVARGQRFLRDLLDRHGGTDDRVAAVSHGAFYNYFLSALLDWPRKDGYWFGMHNTAITRIDFDQDRVTLRYMNRFEHLPPEWVT